MKNKLKNQSEPLRFVTVGETSLAVIPESEKKNPPAAVGALIMAAVIAVSLFIGSARWLLPEQIRVSKAFYDGSKVPDGVSIDVDLYHMSDSAYNMAALAEQVLGADGNVEEVKRLCAELNEDGSISAKYADYVELSYASSRLYSEISEVSGLTDTQSRLIKQCYTDIQSRKLTIENNEYNDLAEKYNKKLTRFPAVIFGRLLGLKEAELFK
ncbi:MAG: LemA family protein [Clostridiales bacterium]|nr:LemA family protein [Clostridiales bacterium]